MKDQYLNNMQFTEKLLQFLCSEELFRYKIPWNPKLVALDIDNKTDYSEFYSDIFWAVFIVIDENIEVVHECYKDFRNDKSRELPVDDIDEANFTRCALKIAPLFFSKGYSHGSFLAYCSMVIGVAFMFFGLKPNCVPQRACQVVALVLFTHQMTGQFYEEGGWKNLRDTALMLLSCFA